MKMEASTSSGKRKKNFLSIADKLEIIRELREGASATDLTLRYNMPRATLNDIIKNADEIEMYAIKMKLFDGCPKKRKTMKGASNEMLDQILWLWFMQKRSEGIPLSGPIICKQAIFLNRQLDGDVQFKASSGWLRNFKNRHGIRFRDLAIDGEKMSAANEETVVEYKNEVEAWLSCDNNDIDHQLLNDDEIGQEIKGDDTESEDVEYVDGGDLN